MADKPDRAPVLGGGSPGGTADAPGTPAPVTRAQRWLARLAFEIGRAHV